MEPTTSFGDEYRAPLATAARIASSWLDGLPERRIVPSADVEQVKDALGRRLGPGSRDAATVVEELAAAVEPG